MLFPVPRGTSHPASSPALPAPLAHPPSWHRACAPGAPVRVAVLANPRARWVRSGGVRALREAAPDARLVETRCPTELPGALAHAFDADVNVLAIAGGDGTLHHALQPLLSSGWTGRIVALGGGTLDIVARGQVARTGQGNPAAALARFTARFGTARLGDVPARDVPLLRVVAPGAPPRHGFVFGSEMVKHAVELYDRFGGGYEGLSRFLFEAGRGYLFSTELWKAERWRLDPPLDGAVVTSPDGARSVPRYSAAIACAVDLAIGGGRVRAVSRRPGEAGFFARVITTTKTGDLLRMIPDLMRGVPLGPVVDARTATRMELSGGYTLDGERFEHPSSASSGRERPLSVEAAGTVRLSTPDALRSQRCLTSRPVASRARAVPPASGDTAYSPPPCTHASSVPSPSPPSASAAWA